MNSSSHLFSKPAPLAQKILKIFLQEAVAVPLRSASPRRKAAPVLIFPLSNAAGVCHFPASLAAVWQAGRRSRKGYSKAAA